MEKPKIAGKAPMPVELEKGKTYAWCSCGQSENQPWCDGKHKGTAFTPKVFVAEEDKTGWMCTCKHSSTPEFCNGAHKNL